MTDSWGNPTDGDGYEPRREDPRTGKPVGHDEWGNPRPDPIDDDRDDE